MKFTAGILVLSLLSVYKELDMQGAMIRTGKKWKR